MGEPFKRRGEPDGLPAGQDGPETDGEEGKQGHARPGPVYAVGDDVVRDRHPYGTDCLQVGRNRCDHGQVSALDGVAHLRLPASRGEGGTARS